MWKYSKGIFISVFRGYFEGNGWISKNKNNVGFISSFDFIHGCKSYLPITHVNIYAGYKDRPKEKNYYRLIIYRNTDKIAFLKWVYSDATIFMNRKRNLAKKLYGV